MLCLLQRLPAREKLATLLRDHRRLAHPERALRPRAGLEEREIADEGRGELRLELADERLLDAERDGVDVALVRDCNDKGSEAHGDTIEGADLGNTRGPRP